MQIHEPTELQRLGCDNRRPLTMSRDYAHANDVTLATSDCIDFLRRIPSETASLVFTSPPYNLGKEYEERVTLEEYRDLMRRVIAECVRIVRPGGSICFQVGNFMAGPQRPKPLAFILDPIFSEYEAGHRLTLRNAIVWHFEHGRHASRRFSGRYEMVLWYSKGDDYLFKLDDVRVPQKYPGKRHFKGLKKGQLSGNPMGKNPGDVWTDIPNVKSNHVEKTEHPCQFPVGLAKRLILSLTNPGDLVVDPFSGVGTTAVAAVLTGRRAAGSDLVREYVQIARARVRDAAAGTLRVRENGPTFTPSATSSVARIPEGFWTNMDDQAAGAALEAAHLSN